MQQQFEYHVIMSDSLAVPAEQLNRFGEEGWRLVDRVTVDKPTESCPNIGIYLTFMRPRG